MTARRSNLATLRDMGALSVVTLLLGAARELLIARDLQASGDADIFFRGLVAVATVRACALAVYRARWIPADARIPTLALLRSGARSASLVGLVGVVGLLPLIGPRDLIAAASESSQALALLALAAAAFLASWAGHLRALAERRGQELRGFGVDWGLALGTIAGTLALRESGALGPSLGLLAGLAVGVVMLWPRRVHLALDGPAPPLQAEGTLTRSSATRAAAASEDEGLEVAQEPAPGAEKTPPGGRRRPLWLLLDALLYGNLGVVDSLFSHLLIAGSLAVLSYAGLFVNSALMLLTGAVTVVALRMAASEGGGRSMRRWSLLGGAAVMLGLAVIGLLLGWAPIARGIEGLLGWDLAGSVRPVVLWSLPYAFLRLANTVGRQRRLVRGDLRGVIGWDVAGLGVRSLLLAGTIGWLGLVAFPVAAAAAELLQVRVWWGGEGRTAAHLAELS